MRQSNVNSATHLFQLAIAAAKRPEASAAPELRPPTAYSGGKGVLADAQSPTSGLPVASVSHLAVPGPALETTDIPLMAVLALG
jgi:hypothetical protein